MKKCLYLLMIMTIVVISSSSYGQKGRNAAGNVFNPASYAGVPSVTAEISLKTNPVEVCPGVYRFHAEIVDVSDCEVYTKAKKFVYFITLSGDLLYQYFMRGTYSDSLFVGDSLKTGQPIPQVVKPYGDVIILQGSILDDQVINHMKKRKEESFAAQEKMEQKAIDNYTKLIAKYNRMLIRCDDSTLVADKKKLRGKDKRSAKKSLSSMILDTRTALAGAKKEQEANKSLRKKEIDQFVADMDALKKTGFYFYSDGFGLLERDERLSKYQKCAVKPTESKPKWEGSNTPDPKPDGNTSDKGTDKPVSKIKSNTGPKQPW